MDRKNYPKVLIINGQSMYQDNATGITLRNIFKNYGFKKLYEIYYYKKPLIKYSKLVEKSIMISRPFSFIFNNILAEKYYSKLNNEILNEKISNIKMNKIKLLIKSFFLSIRDIWPSNISENIIDEINEFKPTVIYTMGASICVLRTSLYFAKRYNCKIILHCMDNWRETLYSSKFLFIQRRILNKYLTKVEQGNFVGLAISNKMAIEYSKISGQKYYALMNCINNIRKPLINEREDVIFTYAGGLHLNRWKELIKIEKCLYNFHDNARIYIYTSQENKDKYKKLFNSKITIFRDYKPNNQIYEVYDESDILVHIESFDEDIIEFTKYSLSTKIPEYMSSGKPILCYAPKEIAVSEYINETKAGISVNNYNELCYYIDKLIVDKVFRTKCGIRGVEQVLKNHMTKSVNKLLLDIFND